MLAPEWRGSSGSARQPNEALLGVEGLAARCLRASAESLNAKSSGKRPLLRETA